MLQRPRRSGQPNWESTTSYSYDGGAWTPTEGQFMGFRKGDGTILPAIEGETTGPKVRRRLKQSLPDHAQRSAQQECAQNTLVEDEESGGGNHGQGERRRIEAREVRQKAEGWALQ